ncbi:MAG TPA: hypothetical protein VNO55_00375, partial [Polyangia bacterium]|nr:hypothetical protein [Polyangia bacterium]
MSRSQFRRSLTVFTLLGAAVGISACADPQAADSAGADGAIRGELVVYAIDQMDGASETQFFLRTEDGVEHRLLFELEPDLVPGTQLKVWGVPEADALRVTDVKSLEPTELGRVSSALKTGTVYPARTFAFILVDTGGGVNTTKDEVLNLMMNNPGSVRSYYQYASYGRQDISVEVFGPIKYTMTGCGTSKLASD